jgi:hypothetical protein
MLRFQGQRMSTVMICLAGSFSIAILSYDAGMINNLTYCAPYWDRQYLRSIISDPIC